MRGQKYIYETEQVTAKVMQGTFAQIHGMLQYANTI